jgi:DNA-directed RNA polymerase specialized sigma24 family protein
MSKDSLPGAHFPRTRASAVAQVGSDDPALRARAFDVVVRAYFAPVYKHLRVRWKQGSDEAREATQAFFARAFEKRWLSDYDAAQARFRTYLRACLDRYVMDARRGEARQKRGGHLLRLSLDFGAAETELQLADPAPARDPEAYFEAEWTRSLLGAAVEELRERCAHSGKERQFKVFQRYVLDNELGGTATDTSARRSNISYAMIARELDLKPTDVTNYLAWTRRELRRILLDKIAELTHSQEEFEDEARKLLGAQP